MDDLTRYHVLGPCSTRLTLGGRPPGQRSLHSSRGPGKPATWRRETGHFDAQAEEVREMRDAETVLGIIQDRGKRGLILEDVYRQLFNPSLYLRAYGRIYRNDGAMTRGRSRKPWMACPRRKSQRSSSSSAPSATDGLPSAGSTSPRPMGRCGPSGCQPGATNYCKSDTFPPGSVLTSRSSRRSRTASGRSEVATRP